MPAFDVFDLLPSAAPRASAPSISTETATTFRPPHSTANASRRRGSAAKQTPSPPPGSLPLPPVASSADFLLNYARSLQPSTGGGVRELEEVVIAPYAMRLAAAPRLRQFFPWLIDQTAQRGATTIGAVDLAIFSQILQQGIAASLEEFSVARGLDLPSPIFDAYYASLGSSQEQNRFCDLFLCDSTTSCLASWMTCRPGNRTRTSWPEAKRGLVSADLFFAPC